MRHSPGVRSNRSRASNIITAYDTTISAARPNVYPLMFGLFTRSTSGNGKHTCVPYVPPFA